MNTEDTYLDEEIYDIPSVVELEDLSLFLLAKEL